MSASVEALAKLDDIPSRYVWDGKQEAVKLLPAIPDSDGIELEDVLRAHIVNRALQQQSVALLYARSSNNGLKEEADAFDLKTARDIQLLQDDIAARKTRLRFHEQELGAIRDAYAQVDTVLHHALAEGKSPEEYMDEWVRARLEPFTGVQIATDVDKTITATDNYLPRIPGSVDAENYMAHKDHGRDTFPLVFVRNWRTAMEKFGDTFFRIGQEAPLRPGVVEFFQIPDLPITLASANFKPLVEGVKSQLPQENIQDVYAVEEKSLFATEKRYVMREVALARSGLALVYIGDGESDLNAIDETVAFYFALRGGKFAQELETLGLPYYEYDDFNDIREKLQELGVV